MRVYDNSTAFTAAVTADWSVNTSGTGTGVTATCKSLRGGYNQDVSEATNQTLTTAPWNGSSSLTTLAPLTNGMATGALEVTLSAAAIAVSVATSGAGKVTIRMFDSNGIELPSAHVITNTLSGYAGVYSDTSFTKFVVEADGSGAWGISAITGLLA